MIRSHTPLWLAQLLSNVEQDYARYLRFPHCESVGEGVRMVRPRHVKISGPGVRLGDHVRIHAEPDASVHISSWALGERAPVIDIGDYVILNPGVRIVCAEHIRIGASCMLATGVYVTDADWHGLYHRVFPPGAVAPVTLEDNVWLADGCTVLKGVTIGQNSVVAARAVVTRDVPANVVVAGNPARVVKDLDPAAARTTRQDLFEQLDYVRFEAEFQKDQLKGNTLAAYVRSLIRPRRGD